ncbi:MAG: response regulator [Angelakisella sp.]|jgi:signal transduction histidine kinase/CheY-like chemotaxis protein|nr:response regulator [Angelakisella sp.]
MKDKPRKDEKNRGLPLLFSILLIFCVLGMVVLTVAQRLSQEMTDSAIQNLSESLDLIQSTIEAILKNEAEFQTLVAKEIAKVEAPEEYIRSYEKNRTMVKLSLIMAGKSEGVSNTGEVFSETGLNFSAGGTVAGLPVSQSYVNHMGAWAYTIKSPVIKDGQEIASLYVEYIYDSLDNSLPDGFYNKQATLYIMDAESERFVLKPKGMGMRSAGHLNLTDFYRANDIQDPGLREEIDLCLEESRDILFEHDIRNARALNYMWAVNDGTIFLVGYVPIEAIQQEGRTVNQNIFFVIVVMLVAFLLCCTLYYFSQRQQNRLRREREAEREVHNKQLAEALQAAQIASKSKTTFLSNMSHDIRTPMNAVIGFTTLLARDAENPAKVREYTRKIMASGQHLLSLINDILDVSKIESGKVVLNYEKFTLSALVSSVDAIIQPMAKAKGQSFHVEVTGIRHEYLIGDEMRLNQILINLLSNAVKYTQEGGSIWFRIIGQKQRSSQYERIRIEVEDNGYGMTPEYLTTIFDAFTRAENSTTNKVQGTGLGMAITKSIVELMGGSIDVSSQMGKGSLFQVEVEFRIPEEQACRHFWEKNGIARVLVVENSSEALENIQVLLEESGVQVDGVPSVAEALRLLEDGAESQLALLDLEQPEGEHCPVGALREALPERVPLILLAGETAPELDAVPQLKSTAILPKPFFVSALQEKIRELESGSGDAAAEQTEENSLAGMRFLVAEDNEINAEILGELLQVEGATCEVTEDGRQVLERFQQAAPGEFDAILMDVQMPVMNGYDATRAIRALAREDARKLPIIAMTANAFAEDEKAALEAGMDAHVTKPIDIELLKRVIRQYVRGKEPV